MEPFTITIGELIHDVCESVTGDLERVLGLWEKMGLSTVQLKERRDTVINQVANVTKNMVKEETRNETKVVKICDNHLSNITTVWSELQCEGKFIIEDEFESFSLLDKEKYLREHLDLINDEKIRRMEEEKCLRKEEMELSSLLGVNHVIVVENILLTENQRAEIENHIVELKKIKENRENSFLNMSEEITSLMEQLEIDINTTSLTDSIMLDVSKSLSMSDLMTVQGTRDKLKKKLKDIQKDAEMVVQEIVTLYDKLKVPSDQRLPLAMGQVVSIQDLYKAQYRSQLYVELMNMKEEKQKHIEELVKNARVELNEIWDRCFISEEDRMELSRDTMGSTDDTLEKIEKETCNLNIYYSSNSALFFKYKKLISLWQSVEDLDIKSRNTNRLLKSRGNDLFKEEKERRRVARLLPKIEQELTTLATEKMIESGLVLMIGRVPLINLIKNLRLRHSRQLQSIFIDLHVATKSINATTFNNNKPQSFQERLKKRQTLTMASSPKRYKNAPIATNLHRQFISSTARTKFGIPKGKVSVDSHMTKDFQFGVPEASSTIIGSNTIQKYKEHSAVGLRKLSISNSSLSSEDSTASSDENEEDSEREVGEKNRKFGFNFKKVRLGEHCAAGRKALKLNSIVNCASRRRIDPILILDTKNIQEKSVFSARD